VRNAEVVSGDEHLVAGLEPRVAARDDRARHVDAADQRKAAHDLAGAEFIGCLACESGTPGRAFSRAFDTGAPFL
jgi:hypothetical protein